MDIRYETFLTLCELMNYRKTADKLNLTQPAVTKQIQSLESEFGVEFFAYDRRKLEMTREAEVFRDYVISLKHNYDLLRGDLEEGVSRTLRVGATKTIGDYVIPDAVSEYLSIPEKSLSLEVDNTVALLDKLERSELDFAVIEGIFDKSKYNYRLLRNEPFSGICSKDNPLSGRTVNFKDLFDETLILREKGSGTRDIFESELIRSGYSVDSFRRCIEISSFSLINRLVSDGIGISFAYRSVISEQPGITTFNVKGLERKHEFNIVWLKRTKLPEEAEEFLSEIK